LIGGDGTNESERGATARLDFGAGALLAALSLGLFVWFIPTFAPGEGGPGQIAPSFFPRLAIAVVFVCALILMAVSARHLAVSAERAGVRLLTEMVGWLVFAVALFALLRWAGFVPAGIFAVACGTLLTRYRRRPLLCAALAIALPLVLDVAAWQIFLIELP